MEYTQSIAKKARGVINLQNHTPLQLSQSQMIELIGKKRGINLSSVTEIASKFKPIGHAPKKKKANKESEFKPAYKFQRYKITLPFPPSMNKYYGRGWNGSIFIRDEGKKFRREAEIILKANGLSNVNSMERIRAGMVFFARDKRKRDWDNIQKATWDCLKKKIYADDSQIDFCIVGRGKPDSLNPRVEIIIDTSVPQFMTVEDMESIMDNLQFISQGISIRR